MDASSQGCQEDSNFFRNYSTALALLQGRHLAPYYIYKGFLYHFLILLKRILIEEPYAGGIPDQMEEQTKKRNSNRELF